MLRVSRQITEDGKVSTLKAKHAGVTRDVPVPAFLTERIAEHVSGRIGRVFSGPVGGIISREHFNEKAKQAALAAGLPEAWVPYQMRHHYATWLLSKYVPIEQVARLPGHASTTVTYQTYSHWIPDQFDALRGILDAA
jgi:integrase